MIKLVCVECNSEFDVNCNSIKEAEGATVDCPSCNKLLVIDNGKILDFHKFINKTSPEWPKDGKGTNYIQCGGVAQLGERLLCKQEVVGSIPITSTIIPL